MKRRWEKSVGKYAPGEQREWEARERESKWKIGEK